METKRRSTDKSNFGVKKLRLSTYNFAVASDLYDVNTEKRPAQDIVMRKPKYFDHRMIINSRPHYKLKLPSIVQKTGLIENEERSPTNFLTPKIDKDSTGKNRPLKL